MRRARRAVTTALLGLVVLLQLSPAASAAFSDRTDPAALRLSTARLAPPTGLAASRTCLLTLPSVRLTWTATTSGFATGYRVFRRLSSASTFTLLTTVNGRTTTSWTDSTVSNGSSYVYEVHAVVAGWTAASSPVSINLPVLCV